MAEQESINEIQVAQSVERILQARDEAKLLEEKKSTVSYLEMMMRIPLRLFYNSIEIFIFFMLYYAYIKITGTPMMSKIDITYYAISLFAIATFVHLIAFIGTNSFKNNLTGFFALVTYYIFLQIAWFYFLANLIYGLANQQ